MSFGFGVGDFLGAAQLAWNLYRYCYKVAQGAPQEFKELLGEITMLSQSIRLLEEEAQNPNSTMVRAGEDRVRMVKEMMLRVEVTLKELQKMAEKYEKLGDLSRPRLKQIWTKVTWSIDVAELDSLRNKLVYHNGVISLLLTSFGNSSLERIESANLRLERRFSEIGGFIQNLATTSQENPKISAVSDKTAQITISAALMKNAEIGQRKWSAIGVEEWIQAGRWWLMKSQTNLSAKSSSDKNVSQQGYLDLIKASWILIDVIARHPQLNLLDSGVCYDVELLAETIRTELGNIEALGLIIPDAKTLLSGDLRIWESQVKGPAMQPIGQVWATTDEDVLFQRFGHYQSNAHAAKTPCVILFLIHKKIKMARIVLGNQSWVVLEEFTGKAHPDPVDNSVQIGGQAIYFSTSLDAMHICAIWDAVEEYLFRFCIRDESEQNILKALILIAAVKRNFGNLFNRLLEDEPNFNTQGGSPVASLEARIWLAAVELASDSQAQRKFFNIDGLNVLENDKSFLNWAARKGYLTVATLLLEGRGFFVNEKDFQVWYSIRNAVRDGKTAVVVMLLAEGGTDVNVLSKGEWLTMLQVAAGEGHETIVNLLLEAGANVNAPAAYHQGRTALQAAAEGGHGAVVDRLLKLGADVNAPAAFHQGRTALQAAAEGGHGAVVDRLLKLGADVNAPAAGHQGRTALQAAAEGGHRTVVDRLIKLGADISAPAGGSQGRTALQAAAEGGHETIVNLLLKAGADVNDPAGPNGGRTALQAAAERGHETIVKLLLGAGADVNAQSSSGGTVLQAAAEGGHGIVVNYLLEAGANINTQPGSGKTPLQAAAKAGFGAVVDQLLKAGADVNAKSRSGGTALQAAAGAGYIAIVAQLLKAGANVNAPAPRDQGGPALQAAASEGHMTVVDMLLKAGADVNAPPALGPEGERTALQAAAGEGHEAIVSQLLEAGADINAPAGADQGRTALQAAAGGGHETIVNLLLNAGADINAPAGRDRGRTALQAATEGGHETIIKLLLEAGADINTPALSGRGRTALQAAADEGHEAVVYQLLKAGADINAPAAPDRGRTALQAAAERGHEMLVGELLEAGADINAPPARYYGRTALQAAAGFGLNAVVDKLLNAGADVNAPRGEHDGRTAIEAANEWGHVSTLRRLL